MTDPTSNGPFDDDEGAVSPVVIETDEALQDTERRDGKPDDLQVK